jgi:hypothetical protein
MSVAVDVDRNSENTMTPEFELSPPSMTIAVILAPCARVHGAGRQLAIAGGLEGPVRGAAAGLHVPRVDDFGRRRGHAQDGADRCANRVPAKQPKTNPAHAIVFPLFILSS